MTSDIRPAPVTVDQKVLDDLNQRLDMTRWPEAATVADWSQGVPLKEMQDLCAYWRDSYDWRRCEAMLNSFNPHVTEIDGLDIWFLHIPSKHENAMPLLLTHGWPGSVIEFHKVIAPLTDPVAHGGRAEDAFHLVIPALPGFGFSGRPDTTGKGVPWTADAWVTLMKRLGYDRFVAQGGDWGAIVTNWMAHTRPPECIAVHLNMVLIEPDEDDIANWDERDRAGAKRYEYYKNIDSGYAKQQATRPQTIGYALTDSPAGQAAWIYEKFYFWMDCDGDPLSVLSRDEILDNIMLYWLTGTAASSARMYWESLGHAFSKTPTDMPLGAAVFPNEILYPSRRAAEKIFTNIIHWREFDHGGHFAAFENPDILVTELRECFAKMR